MTQEELAKRQLAEVLEYEKLRDKAWQTIQDKHQAIKEAFGNKESEIPESMRKLMAREKDYYSWEWSGNNGTYRKHMRMRHISERMDLNNYALIQKLEKEMKEYSDQERER